MKINGMANQGMQSFGRLIVSRDQTTRDFIDGLVTDNRALQQTTKIFDQINKFSGDTPVFFRAKGENESRFTLELFDGRHPYGACDDIRKHDDNDNFKEKALKELGNLYRNFKREFDKNQAVKDMEYYNDFAKELFDQYA